MEAAPWCLSPVAGQVVVRLFWVLHQQSSIFLDRGILFGIIPGLALILGDPAGEKHGLHCKTVRQGGGTAH